MKIAISGGIASGKSELGKIFKAKGLAVISADDINRSMLESEEYRRLLQATFPACIVNGEFDKAVLKSIVLTDPYKLEMLNSISHPLIMREIENCNISPVFVEIPLLNDETARLFDLIIVVVASKPTRLKRAISRGNQTLKEARKFIKIQPKNKDFEKYADIIIDNSGTFSEFESAAADVYQCLKNKEII